MCVPSTVRTHHTPTRSCLPVLILSPHLRGTYWICLNTSSWLRYDDSVLYALFVDTPRPDTEYSEHLLQAHCVLGGCARVSRARQ